MRAHTMHIPLGTTATYIAYMPAPSQSLVMFAYRWLYIPPRCRDAGGGGPSGGLIAGISYSSRQQNEMK